MVIGSSENFRVCIDVSEIQMILIIYDSLSVNLLLPKMCFTLSHTRGTSAVICVYVQWCKKCDWSNLAHS